MSGTRPTALQGRPEYRAFLQGIKDRIRRAQIGAALAANRELVLLYWDIGREILMRFSVATDNFYDDFGAITSDLRAVVDAPPFR